jgi:hypothetical protein
MAQQPQVTRVAPSTGDPNGGQSTTIEGSGFDGLVAVTFESAGGSTKEIANVANSDYADITTRYERRHGRRDRHHRRRLFATQRQLEVHLPVSM